MSSSTDFEKYYACNVLKKTVCFTMKTRSWPSPANTTLFLKKNVNLFHIWQPPRCRLQDAPETVCLQLYRLISYNQSDPWLPPKHLMKWSDKVFCWHPAPHENIWKRWTWIENLALGIGSVTGGLYWSQGQIMRQKALSNWHIKRTTNLLYRTEKLNSISNYYPDPSLFMCHFTP